MKNALLNLLKLIGYILAVIFVLMGLTAIKEMAVFSVFCFIVAVFCCPLTYRIFLKNKNINSEKTNDNFGKIVSSPPAPQQITETTFTPTAPHVSAIMKYSFDESYNDMKLRYKYDDVKVCVIREEFNHFDLLKNNVDVIPIQEPQNPYDEKAVALYTGNIKIGYLFKGKLQDMTNDYLDKDYEVLAYISKFDTQAKEIYINMAFYN